jgi:NAD+ kinase
MPDRPAQALRIAFLAADNDEAGRALLQLEARYAHVPSDQADIIVALGGDGMMLETLHRFIGRGIPIFGMNRGTVGFLMNQYDEADLPARLAAAQLVELRPLEMTARTISGETVKAVAINEVSLLRETRQTAKIAIHVDGVIRLPPLICDGILIATPPAARPITLRLRPRLALGIGRAGPHPHQRLPPRAAGGAPPCPTRPRYSSRYWKATSARSRRSPTIPRCATWSR